MEADQILDCRGLLCPLPVVRTGKALDGLRPGQVLKILVTDRGTIADLPAWAGDTGNPLLSWHEEGDHLAFYIRREEDTARP